MNITYIDLSLTLFLFFQMPVLNASSSQGASAGATSSQGGASSRGKFEKKCTKVWLEMNPRN